MESLMTLVALGSVAAVAIPLAVLLEWWSVRGLFALLALHRRPKSPPAVTLARVPARQVATGLS